jgi:UDP:flavonoid glycosyltransferase YjiC (YdhE family)
VRILVSSTPGLGHIHPLVPVARALQHRGHEVRFATAPAACDTLMRYGFHAEAAGIDLDQRAMRASGFMPSILAAPPRQRRSLLFPVLFAALAGPEMLHDLRVLVARWRPDVIVHEQCELAAAPLARAAGIPHACVGFGGYFPRAVVEAAAPEIEALWATLDLPPDGQAGLYDYLYLHPFPPSFGHGPPAPTVRPCRPVNFDGAVGGGEPEWLDALGRSRPMVYATFGTEFASRAPLGQVVDALADLDVDAVVTLGSSIDPQHVCVSPPPNVRLERYVPQRTLVTRASVVLSHAGSGTMLGAAAAGVPQLCAPIGADQFENADAVDAAGAGLLIEPDEISTAAIRSTIERLLAEPSFLQRAHAVADEIAAMPHPDVAVAHVEALAG